MLQQRKLNDQTKILTWMVIVFVFCQCFTIIADIYDFIYVVFSSSVVPSNIHIDNLICMGHFMLALNSSVNFIFYILHIKAFRKHFVQVHYTKINYLPVLIDMALFSSNLLCSWSFSVNHVNI